MEKYALGILLLGSTRQNIYNEEETEILIHAYAKHVSAHCYIDLI